MKKRLIAFLWGGSTLHTGLAIFLRERASYRGHSVSGDDARLFGVVFMIGGLVILFRSFYFFAQKESSDYASRMLALALVSGVLMFVLEGYNGTFTTWYALAAPIVIALYGRFGTWYLDK